VSRIAAVVVIASFTKDKHLPRKFQLKKGSRVVATATVTKLLPAWQTPANDSPSILI